MPLDRRPKGDKRQLRALSQLASGGVAIDNLSIVTNVGGVMAVNPLAPLIITTGLGVALYATGGLTLTTSQLSIKNPASSGLSLAAGGVSILLAATPALQLAAGGLSVLLDVTTPGLQVTTGLKVKLAATPALSLAAGGLAVLVDPTTPGLQVTAGLKILLDAATPGLQLTTGLKVLIDPTNPGLQLTTGLKVLLDAATPGLQLTTGLKVLLDAATPGLQLTTGLKVLIDPTNPGLQLTTGLKVLLADTSLVLGAGGLGVNLAATPGLEIAAGMKLKLADACLTLAAGGLGISSFVGDAGAGGVKGAVPAPAVGDAVKFLRGDAAWAVPAGTGVIRPGASTDHAIMRWDGVGGTTAQDSTVIVVDDGSMTIPSTIAVAGIAGADQIVNGTFDANLNSWTNAAGAWAWAANDGGVAHASALGDLVQFAPTVNTTYKVTFTIKNWVAGTLGATMGGMNLRLDGASSGVKERYITAQTVAPLTFSSPAGANFDLDTVSVVPYTLPGQVTFAAAGLLATQFPIILGSQEQAIQKTRADGTTVGGNVRGLGAVDFQASRTAATQVVSGQYSCAVGRNNTVVSVGSFCAGTGNTLNSTTGLGGHYGAVFGFNNTLTTDSYGSFAAGYSHINNAQYSIATGAYARTDHYGEHAHSSGLLAATGDAQFTTNVLMSSTVDANPTEAFIAYNSAQKFTVAANTAYSCLVMVQGRKTGGGGCSLIRQVLIENNAGTTALIGAVQTVGVDIKSDAAYAVTITADDAGDYLKVMVTGKAAHSLYWTVVILATKLSYA